MEITDQIIIQVSNNGEEIYPSNEETQYTFLLTDYSSIKLLEQ
jgi:hypothetical protein